MKLLLSLFPYALLISTSAGEKNAIAKEQEHSKKLTQSYQTIMTQVRNYNHRDLISDACTTETQSIDVSTEQEGVDGCVTEQYQSATWTDETVTIDFGACSGDYELACTSKGGVNYDIDVIITCEDKATLVMNDIPLCAGESCNGDDAKEYEEYLLSRFEDNDACSVQVNIEGGRSKSQKVTPQKLTQSFLRMAKSAI